MASAKNIDIFSPFTDNPAGDGGSSSPTGSDTFGDQTFSAGSDATRTPVDVEEVQFANFGQDETGGMSEFSPAPSGLSKAP